MPVNTIIDERGIIQEQSIAPGCDIRVGGLGTYLRTIRVVTPTNIAADANNINAAMAAMSGVGEVRLSGGTFLISSILRLQSKLLVSCHPNTWLLSSVPGDPGPVSPDSCPIMPVLPTADGTATTLSEATTVGARTIKTVASIAANKVIFFGAGNIVQQATVRSVSGNGPYTLTLDEEVQKVFAMGAAVTPLTVVTDVEWQGNGALLTGTGDNGIELMKMNRAKISGMRIAGAFEHIAFSYDVGCRDVTVTDCDIECAGYTPIAISAESILRGTFARVKTHRSKDGTASFWITDSSGLLFSECFAEDSMTSGISITDCTGVKTEKSQFKRSSGGSNAVVGGASSDITWSQCEFDGASDHGLTLLSTATNARMFVRDCRARDNTNTGFDNSGANLTVLASGLVTSGNTQSGVNARTSCRVLVEGLSSIDDGTAASTQGILVDTAASLSLSHFDIKRTTLKAGWAGVRLSSTANSVMSDGQVTLSSIASSYMFGIHHVGSSVDTLSNVTVRGTTGGGGTLFGIYADVGGSVKLNNFIASTTDTATTATGGATVTSVTYA